MELALLLPLLVLLLLAVIQVGLVARDRVATEHVARVAARAAVTDASLASVTTAARNASDLDPKRLTVSVRGGRRPGDTFTVRVAFRAPTEVSLIGALMPDIVFEEVLRGQAG